MNYMEKERSIGFMAWLTILLIIGGVGACSISKPLPAQKVNVDNLRGACKYQAIHQEE